MDINMTVLLSALYADLADFLAHSFVFGVLKFFLFVYSAVLIIDIVLLLLLGDISASLQTTLFGTRRPLAARNRNKVIRRWEAILARLEGENPSQYKAAVLEADAMADEMLAQVGYGGDNMQERLNNVQGYQVESKAGLTEAHEVRNRIINEPEFTLTRDEAREVLRHYQRFFEELELF